MSVPTDNMTNLIDHLYDARTLGIDTVEWLDQEQKTTEFCSMMSPLMLAIEQAVRQAKTLLDAFGPIP